MAVDRLGRKRSSRRRALTGRGALLFGTAIRRLPISGRLLQGGGGAFALVGAIYIASKISRFTRRHPHRRYADVRMAGGSAGPDSSSDRDRGRLAVEQLSGSRWGSQGSCLQSRCSS